jgi:hypothetical protein
LSFKDLFLVGFFLSIGLSGAPTLQAFGIAALLTVVVVFKVALFYVLLTRFSLRARTATLASLSLANYSEFGLLVGAIGVQNGWIGTEWLIIIAIALSMSFILASPLNSAAHSLFERWSNKLRPFETKKRHPDDQPLDPDDAEIAVFGMGRIGTAAYEDMHARHGDIVIGVDFDADVVRQHLEAGRNVVVGDATDIDFWARTSAGGEHKIQLVLFAMPDHTANITAVEELTRLRYEGKVAATAQYDDEVEELKEAGAHAAYNIYAEAGYGFAEHVCQGLGDECTFGAEETST